MGKEAYKSMDRRHANGDFTRYFKGAGLDVGCGNACMMGATPYDKEDGDATFLNEYDSGSFDWVHSSHCLEHLENPYAGLMNWFRVLRRGGHLIVTVPDWVLYEHRCWPSRFNGDHKFAFTLDPWERKNNPQVLWVPEFIKEALSPLHYRVHRMQINDKGYDYGDKEFRDQSAGATGAQCEIEFIVEKT